MEAQMQNQITGSISQFEELSNEASYLKELVTWSYSKLHSRIFNDQEDAFMLDRIKLYLEHGIAS